MSSSTLGFENEAFIRVAYFLWDFLCFSLSLSLSPTAPTTPSERSDGRSDTEKLWRLGEANISENAHGKYIALWNWAVLWPRIIVMLSMGVLNQNIEPFRSIHRTFQAGYASLPVDTIPPTSPDSHTHRFTSPIMTLLSAIPSQPLLFILHQLICRSISHHALFIIISTTPIRLDRQRRVGMRVICPSQARISHIIQFTILYSHPSHETPYIRIMPINDRMYPHKLGPPAIRGIK